MVMNLDRIALFALIGLFTLPLPALGIADPEMSPHPASMELLRALREDIQLADRLEPHRHRARSARRSYVLHAESIELSGFSRLPNEEYEYYTTVMEQVIESEARRWLNAELPNQLGHKLRSFNGWVYYKAGEESTYTRLVPGIGQQWDPGSYDGSEPPSRCYVFLETGMETEAELWAVDVAKRQFIGRVGRIHRINSSPVISPDGRRFAHVINPTTTSDGPFYSIEYFEIAKYADERNERIQSERMLYSIDIGPIDGLKWVDGDVLAFTILSAKDGSLVDNFRLDVTTGHLIVTQEYTCP